MKDFIWESIYKKIAKKLLERGEENSLELVEIIKTHGKMGQKFVKANSEGEFKSIDPFTFFSFFNRSSVRWDRTLDFIRMIDDKWSLKLGLENVTEKDFEMIPKTNSQKAWFFRDDERDKIPLLWEIFREVVSGRSIKEVFNSVLENVGDIKELNITKGLFWINPREYICITPNVKEFLARNGVKGADFNNFNEYRKTIDEIRSNELLQNKRFTQIVFEAGEWKKEPKDHHTLSKSSVLSDVKLNKIGSGDDIPKNVIFYGPPGTGKTFTIQNKYLERFTKKRRKTRIEFFEDIIERNNLKWYECIALAMLTLTSKDNPTIRVPEIAKHDIIKAKKSSEHTKSSDIIWNQLQQRTSEKCSIVKASGRRLEPLIFWRHSESRWEIKRDLVKEKMFETIEPLLEQIDEYNAGKEEDVKNYEFVTFHQSFSYEDFIEGIKPKLGDSDGVLTYVMKKGAFLRIAERARGSDENYAIFIDEINRGNISNIFGELITLIEEDKRDKGDHPLSVTLPYSGDEFIVPSNLYIIATMNTADRSIEAIDSALRRRFSFIEMAPDLDKIKEKVIGGVNLESLLKKINERLLILVGKDKLIGHSYFMNINSIDDLRCTFENNIIPLLEEYFYNDRKKILMVLGKNFVTKKDWNKLEKEGLYFHVYGDDDLEDVATYEIDKTRKWNKEDFISIYENKTNKNKQ